MKVIYCDKCGADCKRNACEVLQMDFCVDCEVEILTSVLKSKTATTVGKETADASLASLNEYRKTPRD